MDPTNFLPQMDMKYSAKPDQHKFGIEVAQRTPELITKFGIKANPVKIRGGLEDVTAGFEDMRQGKVSGYKLVYEISKP